MKQRMGAHDFELLHQHGLEHAKSGDFAGAVDVLRRALEIDPLSPPAHCHLGIALHQLRQYDDALQSYERALALRPQYAIALNNRGVTLHEMKRYREALESYDKALRNDARYAEAFFNRGNTLQALERYRDALASYDRALEINPGYAKALLNRGSALLALNRHDDAITSYERALAVGGDSAEAYHNRGNALRESGDVRAAINSYRRAFYLQPGEPLTHLALIFNLLRTSNDPAEVWSQFQAYEKQFGEQATRLEHRNSPIAGRRLKIGYVSADLREHPVAFHIAPIISNHDIDAFEIYCYANHSGGDATTERIRRACSHWRSIVDLTDDQLAQLVQEDEIDILVDLGGHTGRNRLLTFARKPAPVQVTWLGLPTTTGLSSIDYRLTDALIDPPGMSETYHSEHLVRLSTHACYEPPELPPVAPLPALQTGHLTFGSFNEADKLSPRTCEIWSRVLKAVPDSELLIVCNAPAVRVLRDRLTSLGVDKDRLRFQERLGLAEYLALHGKVDVALDPFPFNGGTVTRNALWVGVPVITLVGAMPVSRVGFALMSEVGLPSFIAANEGEYVAIAARCAADLDGLADLRTSLRERVERAPSSQPVAYTREVEDAYREMWKTWCAARTGGTPRVREAL